MVVRGYDCKFTVVASKPYFDDVYFPWKAWALKESMAYAFGSGVGIWKCHI